MKSGRKLRVAVLYGGRSGEHEVSLISAASVIRNLDKSKYEVIPIGIDKDGRWHLNDLSLIEKERAARSLPIFKDTPEVTLPARASTTETALVSLGKGGGPTPVDVFFPVMHGSFCEDGAVQGLLELADAPYVGAGVLGSAIGMDKEVAKRLVMSAGIRTAEYVTFKVSDWERKKDALLAEIAGKLPFPVFVKPVNLGSSVGIHKVKKASDLAAALDDAFKYDTKVLVERGIAAREIEFSVLEDLQGGEPLVSVAGEITPEHEFYSYEAKYIDEDGARLEIPARVTPAQMSEGQQIARQIFQCLELEGMARVDLFLDKNEGRYYFNEVNTIPGFTHISMYPKLWEHSGIGYSELLDRLIQLALMRHDRRKRLVRDWKV